jgi:glucokinase
MKLHTADDQRIVMTLDAGGTNLKFSAIRGDKLLMDYLYVPTEADNLERCLGNIIKGFEQVKAKLAEPPVAISFAFPGPTDYTTGIVGDLPNLPGFRGGVALGPMLEDRFKIPVFINNDGDLFVYGEAMAGFLPAVNNSLAQAGSPKRYKNLFGVTLGTGFGAGIVRDGDLFLGDNICAGEAWLLRNKLDPNVNAEEGCSIRAVRRVYAAKNGIAVEQAPEPKVIYDIGMGKAPGNKAAAIEAFRQLGEVAGDAIAQAVTLTDSLVVVGGGVSGASALFLQPLVDAMNDVFHKPEGDMRRLVQQAFNFEDSAQRAMFLKGDKREILIPGTSRKVAYDPMPRTAVGMSRLGTSEAVAIGAYAYALAKLG